MKRQKLIHFLTDQGCILLRHGKKHDIYHNPLTGASEPIPRHRDINERLANKILKNLSQS
jgi:hypothetical protein